MRRLRSVTLELAAVAVVTLIATVGYVWAARFGIDLVDEGYFLDLASRVQHGQLPYRDFDTYYTPGIFYLNGAVLSLFGANVLAPRLMMVAIRVGCAVLVYGLARRLASPPFAAVPALFLAGSGSLAGLHPGWPALLGALLMLECLTRADAQRCQPPSRSRMLWLVAAGACAAMAYVFKQNVGGFALLGAAGYIILSSSTAYVGSLVLVARVAFTVAVALVTRRFLSPLLDALLSAAVWLPLVAALVALTAWSDVRMNQPLLGAGKLLREAGAVSLGAATLTAIWLVPVGIALGPDNTPIRLFLGSVNQGALTWPLEAPPHGAIAVALLAIWTPLALVLAWRPNLRQVLSPAVTAALATPLLLWLPTRRLPGDPLAVQPSQFPRLAALDLELGSLLLYLPAVCAWTALLLLATRRVSTPPSRVAWFVLAGAFAQLALFPRADVAHAALAGAPLLITGAWVLAAVHRGLARALPRAGRAAVFAALLIVPVAALTPHVYGRYLVLRHPDPDALANQMYVPLGLARADVLLPRDQAEPLRSAVEFVQEHTSPGEPVFAYPTDPLANFLADRPNPTRFDHFIPGALSADDMHAVVDDLEAARPRFVLWDHGAVVFWRTDRPNRILSDYLWRCYQQVAAFRLYLILERTEC